MEQWLKRYRIFSRFLLLVALSQMVWVTWWSSMYAATASLPGTELALVIAAVQVPATTLFNFVYKTYKENSAI